MKSEVELHLEAGARLLGSVNIGDYDRSIALASLKLKTPKTISFKGYFVAGAGLEPTTFGL